MTPRELYKFLHFESNELFILGKDLGTGQIFILCSNHAKLYDYICFNGKNDIAYCIGYSDFEDWKKESESDIEYDEWFEKTYEEIFKITKEVQILKITRDRKYIKYLSTVLSLKPTILGVKNEPRKSNRST